VKAVVTKSFERIHRSNLVGMGVLPCNFVNKEDYDKVKDLADATFDILGIDNDLKPQQQATLRVHPADGTSFDIPVVVRIDTPVGKRLLPRRRHPALRARPDQVGDPENEHRAVDVVFETTERELLVGVGQQFEENRQVLVVKFHRRLRNDHQRVELRMGLGDQIDARVVGLETGAQHVAALDQFAMPAIAAKSFLHRENLP
jgi:hypothetical protein